MSFILNPPLVLKDFVGFSVIQVGDMTFPESLVIDMESWSALDILQHWRAEIGECLSGKRNKCCVISGLRRNKDTTVPSEWWIAYFLGDKIVVQYQVLSLGGFGKWISPNEWWKNILPYKNGASEWIVTKDELMDWCNQCDVLLSAIDDSRDC